MSTSLIPTVQARRLDDWYFTVNRIYLDRNFYRDQFSIFAHLVEVVGGLSLLASGKLKPGVTPERYIPKAFAWWMALCGKVGVRSVEAMVWGKFPGVCTYCRQSPHNPGRCREMKKLPGSPDWEELANIGKQSERSRPRTLLEWQRMFSTIYPVSDTEQYPATFARFSEEMGELAEALRVFPVAPGYFLSEASDLFAWLMHLQVLVQEKSNVPTLDQGKALEEAFYTAYPDRCVDCRNPVCTCPPILPGTLGRIAHEVRTGENPFSEGGALLTTDEAMVLFDLGARSITLADEKFSVDSTLIRDIHRTVTELITFATENKQLSTMMSGDLLSTLRAIEDLTATHRLTQESLEDLAREIASLPSEGRTVAMGFLTNMAAGPWVASMLKMIENFAST